MHMVSYLLPIPYGLSDRLGTKRDLLLFPKLMTLIYNFQGKHRSNLKTDLNSQHIVAL